MDNKCKSILYTNVPDDVYKVIVEEQARLKINLKKHVSFPYVINSLIRKIKNEPQMIINTDYFKENKR